jgi:23S rRNA (pseudouridine1915-N3)-methyltransferase
VNVTLITVGKNKDKALSALMDDYIKRLPFDLVIKEINPPQCGDSERKVREADLIRAALPDKALVVLLDERGAVHDSIEFARQFEGWQQKTNALVFVIGGADGLDQSLRDTAQAVICFGRLTWPHMLVRLMLVEQLYRAHTILTGHPYHRA